MASTLKIAHLLGMTLFLGSIFGHVFLAAMAGNVSDPGAQAALINAKHVSTNVMTLPGLAIAGLTGLALAWRKGLAGRPWLRIKVVLVMAAALNGALFLAPLGARLAALAAAGGGSEMAALGQRESVLGAVNLALILAVIVIAVVKPRFGRPVTANA